MESAGAFGIFREFVGQDFDRNVSIEPHVTGAIHLAHPAFPKETQDLVRT